MKAIYIKVHIPEWGGGGGGGGGFQGRRTGVAVTRVSKSLILGGWVTKAKF